MTGLNGRAAASAARVATRPSAEAGMCLLCGAQRLPWFSRGARRYERCPGCGLLVVPEGLALDPSGVSIYESHRYLMGYVLDRLSYLHREGWTAALVAAGRKVLAPLRERSVYLNLGDVVILTARRTADGLLP